MKISAALLLWTAATIGSSNAFVSTTSKTVARTKQQQPVSSTNNVGTYSTSFQQLHSQPSSTTTSLPSQDDDDNLTPEKLAEMIEVSFIQSCLQLSQGYIDVLKLFIVAVKTAYETTNLPLDELHDLVNDCPVNSAGRELMKEEVQLRLEWMMVVYEMMGVLKRVDDDDGPLLLDAQAIQSTDTATTTATAATATDSSQARVAQVLQSMLQLQNVLQIEHEQSGGRQDVNVALTTQTIESAMSKLPSLSQLVNSIESPVDKAFLMNDVRVALLMFQVLEEERVCLEDSKGMSRSSSGEETIPRPPIKGT